MLAATLIFTLLAGQAAEPETGALIGPSTVPAAEPEIAVTIEPDLASPVELEPSVGLHVKVCLSDGQQLLGSELLDDRDGFRLELAGAFIGIPRDTWRSDCREHLHRAQGRASMLRIFDLPGDQRLYGHSAEERGNQSVVLLLNHDVIFLPDEVILRVRVPEPDDAVVRSARNGQTSTVLWIVLGVAVVLPVVILTGVLLAACANGGCAIGGF